MDLTFQTGVTPGSARIIDRDDRIGVSRSIRCTGGGLGDDALANLDLRVKFAADINPTIGGDGGILCGHKKTLQDHPGRSLYRHYPYQVQRVSRIFPEISAKGSPAVRSKIVR